MRLNLDSPLTLDAEVAAAPNLTDRFGPDDLKRIGEVVWRGYDQDEQSRSRWLDRTRAAMELALQIKDPKTFPWPNASNVAFPLLTIAAVQFHSRAYPALLSGPNVVKYRVPGVDAQGQLHARAALVSRYMSYQVLEEDEAFEEQHDRLMIHIPIVGCGFIKTRYLASAGHNVSEFVAAQDLVIDYFAKSVDSALRKTQVISLYRNEVYERCVAGTFRDILEETWYTGMSLQQLPPGGESRDKVSGRTNQTTAESDAIYFLEQHTWLDLDQDGYDEPYIVTIAKDSREVVRIAARWDSPDDVERIDGRILRIRAREYFTKFDLIPSPDGGIYGIGFGALVGPLNESVDTLVNQMMDAGTLANTAGGFLGRGAKVRGGAYAFDPFGWNHVDSTGDDLRKSIFPLPVREPSAVLFQLLTLLINYTQRISGSTDVMVGENPGQNTPAHNMAAMVEEGTKIYSAILQRLWKQLKGEFRKLYLLNGRHLGEKVIFGTAVVGRSWFLDDPSKVVPAADPKVSSRSMRMEKIGAVKQSAMMTPGYDIAAVERKYLEALEVDEAETLYPGPDKVPPRIDPRVQVKQIDAQVREKQMQLEMQQFALEMLEEKRVNNAKIIQLLAQAEKLKADAADADAAHELKVVEAQLGMLRDHNEAVSRRLEVMMKGMQGNGQDSGDGTGGRAGGGLAPPSGNSRLPQAPPVASALPAGAMGGGGVGG